MNFLRNSLTGALFAAALLLPDTRLDACTGITLKAQNGDMVYARTLEWGSSDFNSHVVIYPRGHAYSARVPKGMSGKSWKGIYGVAGLDMFGTGCFADAMNEKGLSVGLFYMPGFADYAKCGSVPPERQIAPTDVVAYLLSTCADIGEARKALEEKVEVTAVPEAILGGVPAPLHFIIRDPSGKQLVVEWDNGKPKFFDAKLGVVTNAPTYDWHLINLRNYLGMRLAPKADITIDGIRLSPLGGGSGFLGLPGDFTPPSRFIRAVCFTNAARKTANGGETLYEAFRILDNFNVPLGASESASDMKKGDDDTSKLRSSTCWTIAYDVVRKSFYYHTQNDRRVQKVDLNKIDFGKLNRVVVLPLDDGHQTVLDRTGEIGAK